MMFVRSRNATNNVRTRQDVLQLHDIDRRPFSATTHPPTSPQRHAVKALTPSSRTDEISTGKRPHPENTNAKNTSHRLTTTSSSRFLFRVPLLVLLAISTVRMVLVTTQQPQQSRHASYFSPVSSSSMDDSEDDYQKLLQLPVQQSVQQWTAKPRMVGCYFRRVDSSSWTGRVQRLASPQTRTQKRKHGITTTRQEHNLAVTPMSEHHDRPAFYPYDSSRDFAKENKPKRTVDANACRPRFDWQEQSFPVCNILHEHGLAGDPRGWSNTIHDSDDEDDDDNDWRYRFVAHGFWRDTWRMAVDDRTTTTKSATSREPTVVALKTARFGEDLEEHRHDVTEYSLDKQRIDALTSDRLTASPHAIHMYAYCGMAGIYQFAPGGDLKRHMEQHTEQGGWTQRFTTWQRYQLAYNVTAALRDVHDTERGGRAGTAIVHSDFHVKQFVSIDPPVPVDDGYHANVMPQFRLGDFNMAQFVYWNVKTNLPCDIKPASLNGVFRSPEEYGRRRHRSEKTDVFALGNVLYSILTGREAFAGMRTEQAHKAIIAGERPFIDADTWKQGDHDPYVHALLTAIHMCWVDDPRERASVHEIEEFLALQLQDHRAIDVS